MGDDSFDNSDSKGKREMGCSWRRMWDQGEVVPPYMDLEG